MAEVTRSFKNAWIHEAKATSRNFTWHPTSSQTSFTRPRQWQIETKFNMEGRYSFDSIRKFLLARGPHCYVDNNFHFRFQISKKEGIKMKERRRERERQKERMFSMLINRTFDLVSRNKNLVKPRYQLDKPTHESSFFFSFFFPFFERIKNRNRRASRLRESLFREAGQRVTWKKLRATARINAA